MSPFVDYIKFALDIKDCFISLANGYKHRVLCRRHDKR